MADSKQPTPRLDIRTITDLSGLEALRPAWNELLSASVRPMVFAAWEWQYLCAKHMAGGRNIVVLAVYDGDTLAAVLPLHREKTKLAGLIPTEVFACLGGDITDYNILLVREHYLSAAIPALAEHLKILGLALDFRNVLPGTPLHLLEQYLTEHGFSLVSYETKTALYSYLGQDYDRFIKGLKRKFRTNLNNNQSYMNRIGGYSYKDETADNDLLDTLIRLHTRRWQYMGEAGALAQQQIRAFHSELHGFSTRPFDIRYFTIRHAGEIISIVYGFVFRDRYYFYQSGFDMNHSRISPGNMILKYSIDALIRDGVVAFDMLRGDTHYKHSWATGSMEMRDVILFPPSIRGRLAAATMKAIMGTKRLIPKSIKRGLKSAAGASPLPAGQPPADKDAE